MKRKKLCTLLCAEAVLCILLSVLQTVSPNVFPALAAFPFAQLGMGLRSLSLSGSAGNILAIVLYVLVCLLPSAMLLPLKQKGPLKPEDALLPATTLCLFPVLWLMVNPGHMPVAGSEAVFCSVIWSLPAAWLVLRTLRSLFSADRNQLVLWFSRILAVAAMLYVFEICGVLLPALREQLASMDAGYADTELHFTVIRYLADALPSLLSILLIFRTMDLMEAVRSDSETIPDLAQALSRFCGILLSVSVLVPVFLNVIQLLLQEYLLNIAFTVVLPVYELVLMLGILLLTRYLAENKQLRDDNNLFI